MKMVHGINLKAIRVPNYILVEPHGKPKVDVPIPNFPLKEISPENLDLLCKQFRDDVFKKAGVKDPLEELVIEQPYKGMNKT